MSADPKLLVEYNFSDIEPLTESKEDGGKDWIIEGVFLQADVVNKNHRIYPRTLLEERLQDYDRKYVQQRRAVGELEHPATTAINLENISHKIESIQQDGNNFIGRARVVSEGKGRILAGLLESDIKLGVSSRAMGSTRRNSRGINEVQDDFQLAAVDVVYQPSAPDAYVEGIMENAQFVWDTIKEDEQFAQQAQHVYNEIKNTERSQLDEAKMQAFQRFMNTIVSEL